MATIKAVLETLVTNSNSAINTITFSGTPNNISLVTSKVYNVTSNGPLSSPDNIYDPFVLGGYSKLNDGSQLLDEYNGFISSEVGVGQTITISGNAIPGFVIYFDINNRPSKIKVDGVEYSLDTNIFNYFSKTIKNTYVVTIVKMLYEDSPLMVDAISSYDYLEFTNKDNLLTFNYGTQLTSDDEHLDFGITLPYGELTVFDNNNTIETLAAQGVFTEKGNVKLYVDDKLTGTMLIDTMTYDDDTTIRIRLVSPFDKSNDVYIDKKLVEETMTGYDVLKWLISKSNYHYGFVLNDRLVEYLSEVRLNNVFFDNATLFNQWVKFCELFALRMYQLPNGALRISAAVYESNLLETNTPIKILSKDIYDVSGRKIFVNNKIQNVNYSYAKIEKNPRSEISNVVGPLVLFNINDDEYKEIAKSAVWVGTNDGSNVIIDWDGYPDTESNASNSTNMRCKFTLTLTAKIDKSTPLYLKKSYRLSTLKSGSLSNYKETKSEYTTVYYSALTNEQIEEIRTKGTLTYTEDNPFNENIMINITPASIVGYTFQIKTDYSVCLVAENYTSEEVIVNGNNSNNSFDYPYNELMTDREIIDTNVSEIISGWNNGKRTIHIRTKYGKYSDINDELMYNGSDGSYFQVNDVVRPYKNNTQGLFVKSDGTPIDFRIITSEITYDGLIYLELDLIEENT